MTTNQTTEKENPETEFRKIFSSVYAQKVKILIITVIITVLGTVYSLTKMNEYISSATIAANETSNRTQMPSVLSQLGGFAGINIGSAQDGISNANRIEIVIKSRKTSEAILSRNDLFKKTYPKLWDKLKNGKIDSVTSGLIFKKAIDNLREQKLFIKANTKKGTIEVGVVSNNPGLSKELVNEFLMETNKAIHNITIKKSRENLDFLSRQINETTDPLIREKLLNLYSTEIEKSMLINGDSFEVLEPPVIPYLKSGPNRKGFAFGSFAFGIVFSLIIVSFNMLKAEFLSYIGRNRPQE